MPYSPLARTILFAFFAIAAGLFCGYLNLRLLAAAGRRLAQSAASKSFVLSSLSRVGVFAIVAVAFAAAGPWWCGLLYIAGLLIPLALYAARVVRER
jgi:small-conductance mechanosensitive channel